MLKYTHDTAQLCPLSPPGGDLLSFGESVIRCGLASCGSPCQLRQTRLSPRARNKAPGFWVCVWEYTQKLSHLHPTYHTRVGQATCSYLNLFIIFRNTELWRCWVPKDTVQKRSTDLKGTFLTTVLFIFPLHLGILDSNEVIAMNNIYFLRGSMGLVMSDLQTCIRKTTLPTHITFFWHFLKLHNLVREFRVNNGLLYCFFPKIK